MTIRNALLIPIFIFCAILIGCAADDDNDEDEYTAQDYVNLGKHYLTENESLEAEKAFEAALDIKHDSEDAQFGLFLARLIRLPNLIDQIIGTISSISFEDQANDQAAKSLQTQPEFSSSIHEYLYENVGGRLFENEELYETLATASNFEFDIERYAIMIDESALMEFSGRFDQCDVAFLGGLDAVLNALMNFLLSVDLSFDPTLLILPDTEEVTESNELVLAYLELIENLLTSEAEPSFLRYREDGSPYLQQTAIDLGNAFARIADTYDCMTNAALDRSIYQVRYFDRNADGVYTPYKDPVDIGDDLELNPDLAAALQYLADLLPPAFYEGTEADSDPSDTATITPADFNELLYGLDLLPIELGPIVIDALPDYPEINISEIFVDPDPNALRDTLLTIIDIANALLK